MSGKRPAPTALATRGGAALDEAFLRRFEQLAGCVRDLNALDEVHLSRLDEPMMSGVLALAREALELRRRKLDESGSDLPPRDADDGGGGGGGEHCGACCWCHAGRSEEANMVVGKCHADPPVVWRGTSTWRFLRPEVEEDTPACSRWKARQ